MKDKLTKKEIKVYGQFIEHPDVPANTIYLLNPDYMRMEFKKRKDGKPDMRVRENKMIAKYGVPYEWMRSINN